MRPPKLGTLFALGACLTLAIPASGLATPEIGEKSNGYSICDEQALKLYAKGMKTGFDFGRNRIEDGKLLANGEVIPEPRPCEWRDYLDAQLHPVVESAPVVSSSSTEYVAPTASTSVPPASTGGCTGMEAESGTDGYSAYNPSSGAEGCYQVIPSTEDYYDCDLGTPVGQDICAARICADQGPSAWSASGANPC